MRRYEIHLRQMMKSVQHFSNSASSISFELPTVGSDRRWVGFPLPSPQATRAEARKSVALLLKLREAFIPAPSHHHQLPSPYSQLRAAFLESLDGLALDSVIHKSNSHPITSCD